MRPISVSMPVATTSASPFPVATVVPRKTMFRAIAEGTSCAGRDATASFSTGSIRR